VPFHLALGVTGKNYRLNVSSVRNKEIEFYRTIDDWWSPTGPLAQLHRFNGVRVNFIRRNIMREVAAASAGVNVSQEEGLKGLKAIDIGCGAGILSESLARLGFGSVTGVDPTDKCIALAQDHLNRYSAELQP